MTNKGYIAIDLDRTLARYVDNDFLEHGLTHIREPIPEMLERVKKWLVQGHDVRLFTARMWGVTEANQRLAIQMAIESWCYKHLGQALMIIDKDYDMKCLIDDRCVAIEPNSGKLLSPLPDFLRDV